MCKDLQLFFYVFLQRSFHCISFRVVLDTCVWYKEATTLY